MDMENQILRSERMDASDKTYYALENTNTYILYRTNENLNKTNNIIWNTKIVLRVLEGRFGNVIETL